jgi:hypothetical protein
MRSENRRVARSGGGPASFHSFLRRCESLRCGGGRAYKAQPWGVRHRRMQQGDNRAGGASEGSRSLGPLTACTTTARLDGARARLTQAAAAESRCGTPRPLNALGARPMPLLLLHCARWASISDVWSALRRNWRPNAGEWARESCSPDRFGRKDLWGVGGFMVNGSGIQISGRYEGEERFKMAVRSAQQMPSTPAGLLRHPCTCRITAAAGGLDRMLEDVIIHCECKTVARRRW